MMGKSNEIKFFNRRKASSMTESVYGGDLINFIYENSIGQKLGLLIPQRLVSRWYGLLQESSMSARKVNKFIRDFDIKIDDFILDQNGKVPYKTFNDFFTRKFKPGRRSFPEKLDEMGAFAEGRYLGYKEISNEIVFPVKGKFLSVEKLLENSKYANRFSNGPLLIARLCPTDYHRFHFPDDCTVVNSYKRGAKLHSVNPVALKHKNEIFCENERIITLLESKNFGLLAYIEVGALCVGKIEQTYQGIEQKRGSEKGRFLFGGSTVILLGENGKWQPSNDIMEKTHENTEVFIELGDRVANY
ncbi:phosphatidylserine decarboxylase [Bacteriovoracaceae bacterium]|nr:phosphatidylserine decarboxylase [Bacteriovoracaceae bacterium]